MIKKLLEKYQAWQRARLLKRVIRNLKIANYELWQLGENCYESNKALRELGLTAENIDTFHYLK